MSIPQEDYWPGISRKLCPHAGVTYRIEQRTSLNATFADSNARALRGRSWPIDTHRVPHARVLLFASELTPSTRTKTQSSGFLQDVPKPYCVHDGGHAGYQATANKQPRQLLCV